MFAPIPVSLFQQPPAASPLAGPFGLLIQMAAIGAIFYFLLIAPMRKKQKKLQDMIESIKKGDRVLTSGGIYGTVAAVEGNAVQLRIAEQVKVRVAKSAITGIENDGGEDSKS